MDNATNANVANLKADAGKRIQTRKAGLGTVAGLLQEGGGVYDKLQGDGLCLLILPN